MCKGRIAVLATLANHVLLRLPIPSLPRAIILGRMSWTKRMRSSSQSSLFSQPKELVPTQLQVPCMHLVSKV